MIDRIQDQRQRAEAAAKRLQEATEAHQRAQGTPEQRRAEEAMHAAAVEAARAVSALNVLVAQRDDLDAAKLVQTNEDAVRAARSSLAAAVSESLAAALAREGEAVEALQRSQALAAAARSSLREAERDRAIADPGAVHPGWEDLARRWEAERLGRLASVATFDASIAGDLALVRLGVELLALAGDRLRVRLAEHQEHAQRAREAGQEPPELDASFAGARAMLAALDGLPEERRPHVSPVVETALARVLGGAPASSPLAPLAGVAAVLGAADVDHAEPRALNLELVRTLLTTPAAAGHDSAEA